jgi:transcriptional regulator with XRE-family HTH domain
MSGHIKWSNLRDEVLARPGAEERLAKKRAETLEEIRLYELRHAEAVSQAELAGRLDVTQGAISKFEHAEDVRVSTLREYLDALGARLELVAVFDEEDRRVPVHLGATPAQPSTGSSTGSSRTKPHPAASRASSKPRKPTSQARKSTQRNRRPPDSDHS